MFNIKKLLFIIVLTFIPRKTQDNLLRIVIDPEFRRILKACRSHYWLQQSRKYSMTCNIVLLHQLSLLLFRFVVFHYDMKLSYCGVLLFVRFSAKQQCSYPKMTVKMTSKTRVWPVKSAIRPDIVCCPAVIFSPAGKNYWQIYGKSKASLWSNLRTGTPPKFFSTILCFVA